MALLFLASSCTTEPKTTLFQGVAMTIPYRIMVGERVTPKQQVEIESCIAEIFTTIDTTFNNWNPLSEISRFNQQPADEKILLSEALATFLQDLDRLVHLSEGRFDPTVAPLSNLWKERLKGGSLPTDEELAPLLPAIGWNKIHLNGIHAWKEHALTALDLGGIAKGYSVDMLLEKLSAKGYSNLYVEWGGEVRTAGSHPLGRPWKIAIAPLTEEMEYQTLPLEGEAIATSGDYLQKWKVEGLIYTHLIDPRTCHPLLITDATIGSATVIASTCTLADTLATTLMLFPTSEEAIAWAAEREEIIFCTVASRAGGPVSLLAPESRGACHTASSHAPSQS